MQILAAAAEQTSRRHRLASWPRGSCTIYAPPAGADQFIIRRRRRRPGLRAGKGGASARSVEFRPAQKMAKWHI